MSKILFLIKRRKKEIIEDIELDNEIGADNYTNVARLKELQKLEKLILLGGQK